MTPTIYPKTEKYHKRFPQKRIFDLADINDRKVAIGTKEDAKRLSLWRRIAHIFLFNPADELLICRRPKFARTYPNLFTSSAGGHVEKDESYLSAAKRELYEELHIKTLLKHIGRFDVVGRHGKVIHHLYIGRASKKIRPNSHEISMYKFVGLKSLLKNVKSHPKKFALPFKSALELYIKNRPD